MGTRNSSRFPECSWTAECGHELTAHPVDRWVPLLGRVRREHPIPGWLGSKEGAQRPGLNDTGPEVTWSHKS